MLPRQTKRIERGAVPWGVGVGVGVVAVMEAGWLRWGGSFWLCARERAQEWLRSLLRVRCGWLELILPVCGHYY